jgi:ABC-type transport system substrate-binding protein
MIGAKFEDGRLQLDPETGVASDWQISDDGLTWEFTIKDGVTFHDGSKLDVEDVEFSWNWGISEEATGVSTVRLARQVVDQGVTGPNTYQVTTQEPLGFFATAVSEIDNLSTGSIIDKDHWMSLEAQDPPANCTPEEICARERSFEANPGPGMAGAYNVTSHVSSEKFVHER